MSFRMRCTALLVAALPVVAGCGSGGGSSVTPTAAPSGQPAPSAPPVTPSSQFLTPEELGQYYDIRGGGGTAEWAIQGLRAWPTSIHQVTKDIFFMQDGKRIYDFRLLNDADLIEHGEAIDMLIRDEQGMPIAKARWVEEYYVLNTKKASPLDAFSLSSWVTAARLTDFALGSEYPPLVEFSRSLPDNSELNEQLGMWFSLALEKENLSRVLTMKNQEISGLNKDILEQRVARINKLINRGIQEGMFKRPDWDDLLQVARGLYDTLNDPQFAEKLADQLQRETPRSHPDATATPSVVAVSVTVDRGASRPGPADMPRQARPAGEQRGVLARSA